MPETALGTLLRSLRDRRALSLREVSHLAGIDHAYIYRLETGAKEAPSEEVLSKLARALKAGRREAQMLGYLSEHNETDPGLVKHVLEDTDVTYDVFTAVAGTAFRGTGRPDYKNHVARIQRILAEEPDRG
jgi:transcriptional regulator with XRE-family HTH domain